MAGIDFSKLRLYAGNTWQHIQNAWGNFVDPRTDEEKAIDAANMTNVHLAYDWDKPVESAPGYNGEPTGESDEVYNPVTGNTSKIALKKETAKNIAYWTPVVGDAMVLGDVAKDISNGNYLSAAAVLPFMALPLTHGLKYVETGLKTPIIKGVGRPRKGFPTTMEELALMIAKNEERNKLLESELISEGIRNKANAEAAYKAGTTKIEKENAKNYGKYALKIDRNPKGAGRHVKHAEPWVGLADWNLDGFQWRPARGFQYNKNQFLEYLNNEGIHAPEAEIDDYLYNLWERYKKFGGKLYYLNYFK